MGYRAFDNVLITGLAASGTTDASGTWNENVGLDSFVSIPSGATGVILRINNGNSSPRWAGVRTPGKTAAERQFDSASNERAYDVVCQLGAGNTIDLYCENATDVTFRILAVVDWTFLDIDSPTTISSTGSSWASRTLSVTGGSIAAVVDLSGGWRPFGATTDTGNSTSKSGYAVVKLDGSLRAEFNTGTNRRIVAEIASGVTFPTWLGTTDASPTFDSAWHTSGLTNAGKQAAHIEVSKTTATAALGFRKTGSSIATSAGSTGEEFFYSTLDASGQFDYWAETGGSGHTHYVHAWFDDFSTGGLSITSVDTDNAVLAGQSQATFAGTGLASTAKFAVKRGSAIAYGADISLSGSTGGSFTAPTMTAMFSAGVRFGDVAFYAAETSGTAIASISGSITTATNWKYVNVTDLSATGSMGSLFYGNAVSLSDQVAYSSVTTRFRWPVTVSGDGYFTVNSSGSQAGDEFAYRIWDETDSTWGTEGTIEVNGGISSAEQVYAAGSLVQASLESSTLEGATLQ